MSIPVGDHGLICLDGNDYSAVALGMQCNAGAINDSLTDTSATLTAYGNRYVARFVSTSTTTGGANSGLGLPDGTGALSVLSPGLGVLPQGWYSASGSMTYQATGAITASSYRRALIMVNFSTSAIPPSLFQVVTTESGTGTPDSLTVNAWFYSNGVTSTSIQLMFGHGNAASSVTVAVGAVLTLRFLSSGLVT
jgi:hypothetical protein